MIYEPQTFVVERGDRSDKWHWQAEFADEQRARTHLAFMKKLVPDATFRLVHVVSTRVVVDPEKHS